ncbi:hypothetical protein B0H14DRAFT_2604933 [Mycena olivaceomarginata]|nr:hypothetical protein B0H14DRAFT_2604933 [Mycena olivaceomarginata]
MTSIGLYAVFGVGEKSEFNVFEYMYLTEHRLGRGVTAAAGSHVEGVILGKTAITLQTGSTANSRLLAQTFVALQKSCGNGAIVLRSNTGTVGHWMIGYQIDGTQRNYSIGRFGRVFRKRQACIGKKAATAVLQIMAYNTETIV